MARFFTNFDEYSTGVFGTVAAADFTVQADAGGDWVHSIIDLGSGDHAFQSTRTATAESPNLFTKNGYSGTGDFEAYCRIVLNSTADQNKPVGVALIASDNRAYAWRPTAAPTSTQWRISLFSNVGGVSASIGAGAISFTEPSAGTAFRMMIGRSGTTIYGSVWLDGDSRPGSPSLSGTDTTLTTVAPGMYTLDVSDVPFRFLAFGAGSGGDTAPEAPISGGSQGLRTSSFMRMMQNAGGGF